MTLKLGGIRIKNLLFLFFSIISVYAINIIAYFVGEDPKSIMVLLMPFYFGSTSIYFKVKYPEADEYSIEYKFAKSMIFLTIITSILAVLILVNIFK